MAQFDKEFGQGPRFELADIKDRVREWQSSLDLKGRMERNPFGMLAAAAAIGYVIAGGLPTAMTRRIVALAIGFGLRRIAMPALQRELWAMARGKADGHSRPQAPAGSSSR